MCNLSAKPRRGVYNKKHQQSLYYNEQEERRVDTGKGQRKRNREVDGLHPEVKGLKKVAESCVRRYNRGQNILTG